MKQESRGFSHERFKEAKNNDGSNKLNKATFSSDLCIKLLNIYSKSNSVVYDPFIGTGTTAIACLETNNVYVGSEISENQVLYSNSRINTYMQNIYN